MTLTRVLNIKPVHQISDSHELDFHRILLRRCSVYLSLFYSVPRRYTCRNDHSLTNILANQYTGDLPHQRYINLPVESVTLYLMVKGPWWHPEGENLNGKVWVDRVYFGAEPPPSIPQRADDRNPIDGTSDVPRDVVLSWLPGAFAATHDVYLGTAFEDVPDDWVCPECGVGKDMFEPLD